MSVNKGSASRGLSSNSQSGGSQLLPDVQVFTADGTWNKPSGSYQFAEVRMIGGGGGGSSGNKTLVLTGQGGMGGAGAAGAITTFPFSSLGATEAVVVGQGGTGGAAVSTNNNPGIIGGNGTDSTFGTPVLLTAGGGLGGDAPDGLTPGLVSTPYTPGMFPGGSPGPGGFGDVDAVVVGGNGVSPGIIYEYAGTGGGGGGGSDLIIGSGIPGSGADNPTFNIIGGAGGAPPTAGQAAGGWGPGTGGGGGRGSQAFVGSVTFAGATGALYGGGGGGGGAGSLGFNSGAGGNGANGIVVVISY